METAAKALASSDNVRLLTVGLAALLAAWLVLYQPFALGEKTTAGSATKSDSDKAAEGSGSKSKGGEMKKLSVGDKAPAFTLLDQSGKKVSLSSFKGKKVLVYFYPRANTPGCTKQACSVRDSSKELTSKNIVTLGISPDKPEKQKKFDDKYTLGFPLLSDPDHKVAAAYGAWGSRGILGSGIIRSSFLINEKGKIVQVSYKVKPKETVPNAFEALMKQTTPATIPTL